MARICGPVDDSLESVADFLIRHRGRRLSDLDRDEQEHFRRQVARLEKFFVRIARFATDDDGLIEAVFWDILDGFRSHVGRLAWIRSTKWLLAVISLGLTPSGRLYVEARQRLQAMSTKRGDVSPPVRTPVIDDDLKTFAFDDKFSRQRCSLRKHKRNPQLNAMVFCARGCDLFLLEYLKFHEITIARLHGLTRSTMVNRMSDCHGARTKARLQVVPGALPHSQQLQAHE